MAGCRQVQRPEHMFLSLICQEYYKCYPNMCSCALYPCKPCRVLVYCNQYLFLLLSIQELVDQCFYFSSLIMHVNLYGETNQ